MLKYQLFVVDGNFRGESLVSNIRALLAEHGLFFELEIINPTLNPARAINAGIAMVPTLIQSHLGTVTKVCGMDILDPSRLSESLGLTMMSPAYREVLVAHHGCSPSS